VNIVAAQERLVGARNLAEVLDAAYDAFEDLIAVIDGSEEPGGGVFTAYVVAAGRAADGRDAIAAAPSLPPAGRPGAVERGTGRSGAEELAGLSRVIADRLSEYASLAEEAGDRAACLDGAESARRVCALLAGS
jgi:hypothetical protein